MSEVQGRETGIPQGKACGTAERKRTGKDFTGMKIHIITDNKVREDRL